MFKIAGCQGVVDRLKTDGQDEVIDGSMYIMAFMLRPCRDVIDQTRAAKQVDQTRCLTKRTV